MPVDYDLIVVGNTVAGRYAASLAARNFARVALVTQSQPLVTSPDGRAKRIDGDRQATLQLIPQYVDVVEGEGRFAEPSQRSPGLVFTTPSRRLTARKALIAVDAGFQIPKIEGFADLSYLLPAAARSQAAQLTGQNITVLGHDPDGLEAALTLQTQGAQVTIITPERCLLPTEDRDLVHHLQAQLEATGVTCLTHTQVGQIQPNQTGWRLRGIQLNTKSTIAVQADQIILATPRTPDLSPLNLEAQGVPRLVPVQVNRYLQSLNPHLFFCGGSLGGYACPSIAQYEAKIAVQNALRGCHVQTRYQSVPWHLQMLLPLARVGLTEAQAHRRFLRGIQVIRHTWDCPMPNVQGIYAAVCKLIVNIKGDLVGAHVMSLNAAEVIAPLALMIEQQMPISAITALHSVETSEFEHVRQGVEDWLLQKQAQDLRQRDRAEEYFWQHRLQGQ